MISRSRPLKVIRTPRPSSWAVCCWSLLWPLPFPCAVAGCMAVRSEKTLKRNTAEIRRAMGDSLRDFLFEDTPKTALRGFHFGGCESTQVHDRRGDLSNRDLRHLPPVRLDFADLFSQRFPC